jgi:hypothetical protein
VDVQHEQPGAWVSGLTGLPLGRPHALALFAPSVRASLGHGLPENLKLRVIGQMVAIAWAAAQRPGIAACPQQADDNPRQLIVWVGGAACAAGVVPAVQAAV